MHFINSRNLIVFVHTLFVIPTATLGRDSLEDIRDFRPNQTREGFLDDLSHKPGVVHTKNLLGRRIASFEYQTVSFFQAIQVNTHGRRLDNTAIAFFAFPQCILGLLAPDGHGELIGNHFQALHIRSLERGRTGYLHQTHRFVFNPKRDDED